VYNKDNPLKVGDVIEIGGTEIEISCALSQGLFGDSLIVICSQETYDRLIGEEEFCLIGVQLEKSVTGEAEEKVAAQIRSFESDEVVFSDLREQNRQDAATYLASRIVSYGFLAIIGFITWFNIMNSISMSVSARIRQYGTMRAVGMDDGQLARMIFSEAFTYAGSGLVMGLAIGIWFGRFLYEQLITSHMGIAWHFPLSLIGVVSFFVLISAVSAVCGPVKRMRGMGITETINEL